MDFDHDEMSDEYQRAAYGAGSGLNRVFGPTHELDEINLVNEFESAAALVAQFINDMEDLKPGSLDRPPTTEQINFMMGLVIYTRREAIKSVAESIQLCIV